MKKTLLKKLLSLTVVATLLAMPLTGCVSTSSSTTATATHECFNTVVTLTINSCSGDESADDIINECFGLCYNYEKLFSRTKDSSDVSAINNSNGQPVEVKPVVAELIEDSIYYSELSNGAFDITIAPLSILWNITGDNPSVPSSDDITNALSHVNYKNISVNDSTVTLADPEAKIDLGGIAKGFVADKIKSYMVQTGVTSAIINLGGNIVTIGGKKNGGDFNIGIQKPFGSSEEYSAIVKGSNLSIVTSGSYERYFKQDGKIYHHILDTKTGYPVDNRLLSVTIISEDSLSGDALSTTCFALGVKKGMRLIENTPGIEAVFIDKDYTIHSSSGLVMDEGEDGVPTISVVSPESLTEEANEAE